MLFCNRPVDYDSSNIKDMVDNITYSQEMSGDEVLELFKDRLLKENPSLLIGKNAAKNLEYEIPNF